MKVVIAGATGLIGGGVLRQMIRDSAITSIISIGRRELPASIAKDPKLKHIIVEDMGNYSEAALQEMAGAEGCVWAIGGAIYQAGSVEAARNINIEYPLALARLFATNPMLTAKEGNKFRFLFTSGALGERDISKKLWFLSESRKMKGEIELKLIELEQQYIVKIEVFLPRPAGVARTNTGIINTVMGPMAIGNEELAASIVDIIVNGSTEQAWDNATLKARGKELLKKQNS